MLTPAGRKIKKTDTIKKCVSFFKKQFNSTPIKFFLCKVSCHASSQMNPYINNKLSLQLTLKYLL